MMHLYLLQDQEGLYGHADVKFHMEAPWNSQEASQRLYIHSLCFTLLIKDFFPSGDSMNAPSRHTHTHTTTNYAVEFCTIGEISGVSTSQVQQISLTLGKPFAWSWYLLCQVSLLVVAVVVVLPFGFFAFGFFSCVLAHSPDSSWQVCFWVRFCTFKCECRLLISHLISPVVTCLPYLYLFFEHFSL